MGNTCRWVVSVGVCLGLWAVPEAADAQTGKIIVVNRNLQGVLSDGAGSTSCGMSADGRYVAFNSASSDLVAGDTNGMRDIFVLDQTTNTVERVSVATDGTQQTLTFVQGGNQGTTNDCSISADGRYVAFTSSGAGLAPNPSLTNAGFPVLHLYLRDRQAGTTTRLIQGAYVFGLVNNVEAFHYHPDLWAGVETVRMTPDGRYLLFKTTSIITLPATNEHQLHVLDRQTGAVERVSVNAAGEPAANTVAAAVISADGRYVAFTSSATNLVAGDTNNANDHFVRDRTLGTTERVNVSTAGVQANQDSFAAQDGTPSIAISDDGRWVAFITGATNLVSETVSGTNVYLRDRQTGTTTIFGQSTSGTPGNGGSAVVMSSDGRYLALVTQVRLTSDDPGPCTVVFTAESHDLYVYDRQTGGFTRDVRSLGCGSASGVGGISTDARFVLFSAGGALVNGGGGASDEAQAFLLDRTPPAPTVTSVQATSGPATGGLTVTLTGTNFWGFGPAGNSTLQPVVRLGGVAMTEVQVQSATSLTGKTAARPAALVAAQVVNPDGGSATANAAFTYQDCTYSLAGSVARMAAAGGTLTVTVATQAGCAWNGVTLSTSLALVSPPSWARLPVPPNNTGDTTATFNVTVDASGAAAPRSLVINVMGQQLVVPQDGVCTVSASPATASRSAAVGTGELTVTSPSGCTWEATDSATWLTFTSPTTGTGSGGSVFYSVTANTGAARQATVTVTAASGTATHVVSQAEGLAPRTLQFAGTKSGATVTSVTPLQVITVGFPTPGVAWTATSNVTWLQLTTGGTGPGTLGVSVVNPSDVIGASPSLSGTVTITSGSTSVQVPVTLTMSAAPVSSPVGQVDTPLQSATGLQGAFGVTGWVVDDIGVQHVRIYRQCLSFDNQAACQLVLGTNVVLVGEASVIPGARPDVEALYPNLPASNRAGWGFLILSNLLPNIPLGSASGGGEGTFTLYVVATDVEGRQTLLGRTVNDSTPTTVTVANSTIGKPFGAIDTPGQGATVSGTLNNFGWALTPDPGTTVLIPTTGSTINVFIDGAVVGTATYNLCRGTVGNPVPAGVLCDDDVSSIFRGTGTTFRNLDAARGAIGLRSIDTTALTNGLHTISWGVTDSANRSEGIGSRYFNVLNSSADAEVGRAELEARQDRPGLRNFGTSGPAFAKATAGRPRDLVFARTGYDLHAAYTPLEANAEGVPQVRIPEHGRIELQIPGVVDGALIVNGEARALPIGVGIDRERGIVTWVAGAGYLGSYRLAFEVRGAECAVRGTAECMVLIDVTVAPATTTTESIRMHLDRIGRDGQLITLHGWGLDPHAATGPGIGAVHIWAKRKMSSEAISPEIASELIFLGVASLGIARPDVSAAHGAQFPHAGFVFEGVLPGEGEWEVTAYAWVIRTGRFEDARTLVVGGVTRK